MTQKLLADIHSFTLVDKSVFPMKELIFGCHCQALLENGQELA
jgi:hypothetical protein